MWSCVFIFFACICTCYADSRVIYTAQGPVKGYKENGLYAFYNIPYAKAPTGRDRFKPPLPAPARTYVLEARDRGILCPQPTMLIDMFPQSVTMTEDCLVANVYIPDTTNTNLPVVVYVHGGGYIVGYGNLFTYNHFVKTHEVIVVTFNYRLGAHGFLCLGTDAVPGNAGMKDQVALLRWVKENIANFGGDPDDVTIAGYSAGSSSVDLLMLSDMTKGLFTKVIPESRASTAAWSVQIDPIKNAQEYGKLLNFTNDDVHALEEFYKTISYEILTSKQFELFYRPDSTVLFSPCVERDTQGEEFLLDNPVNIIKSGKYSKLPMLYGFVKTEGLVKIETFNHWIEVMRDNFDVFMPTDLHFNSDEDRKMVANTVKQFYFGDTVTDKKVMDYVNFFSDVLFTYSTLRSVKLHLEAGHDKIYLYQYSFVHDDLPIIPHTMKQRGPCHGAQSADIADGNFTLGDESLFPKEAQDMKKMMRELWYSFITTGQPVPEGSDLPAWPPVGKDLSYMTIDNPMRLNDSLLKERTEFWDEIYSKYYHQPSQPIKSQSTDHIEL
ncbi:unnamed protein product [Pieris macdunnoughi]|uniref:Carboxylic ester hydrolase n=1 Tax=Pieris macdunnoughi TaxID=345717 RepID=A0A821VVP7_9NEOP|nr:unnamed protein product [Pieris macdunnoughi]